MHGSTKDLNSNSCASACCDDNVRIGPLTSGAVMQFSPTDIIAGLALLISAFVAGWTVYRDVVQKPKFRVEVAVKNIYQQGHDPIGPDLYVEALNLGPLRNRVGLVFARPGWFSRKILRRQSAHIMHDGAHMGNTAKGQMVDVGDVVTFVFPIHGAQYFQGEFAQLGVADGYGRIHWASARGTAKAFDDAKRLQEADSA